MSANKSDKKKLNISKTFSLRFRFLATVIAAILAITVLVGGLSLYEVDNYIEAQAENFVSVTCDNESTKINDSLRNIEESVKIMESYLMDFFTSKVDIKDRDLQEKVIKNADQMFTDVAKYTTTSGTIAYYFRFDPTISDGKAGLFYSKETENGPFVSLELTDVSLYDRDDAEYVGWLWQPYEAGEAIWIKPYLNKNTDKWMISYVIPMYFEGDFIGVVGMDFDYNLLSQVVHKIELYQHGFAHLEMDGEMICSGAHGKVGNDKFNDTKYMRKSKDLVNGMTLVLSASYDDIRQIKKDITYKILFAALMVSIVLMIIAVIAVKKMVDPLKKLTNASVKLADGDYDVEIADSSTYEIKLLSAAFENMATHLREREELLHHSANYDSLTGLRNTTSYTAWVTKFDEKIKGKQTNFGVVVFDLNGLKEANDKYGHDVGNKLIVTAAKVIAEVFESSPVFRIGGDEFLVVVETADLDNWAELFARFNEKCATTFVEEKDVKLPISIASGFVRFDPDKDNHFEDVFKRADDAMYENKNKAKNNA